MYNENYEILSDLFYVMSGVMIFLIFLALIISIYSTIVMWKIFKKADKPGWASLVPFYNNYVLYEITWGNGWYFLLNFLTIIPYVGFIIVFIINILTYIKLAKAFGKDGGFAVGLTFLNLIFLSILAFDRSEYLGAEEKETNNYSSVPVNKNTYCTRCGYQSPDKVMYCPNCGNKIE